MVPMKILVVLAFTVISPLLGQDDTAGHPIDVAMDKCLETAMTTQSMVECGDQAGISWEAEVQKTYDALLKSLEGEQREALIRAQNAWLIFLEAELHAIGELHTEGTISRIDRAFAAKDLYRDRALQLHGHLDPRGQFAK